MVQAADLFYTIEIEDQNCKNKSKIKNYYEKYFSKPIKKITRTKYGRATTIVLSASIGIIVYISSHYAGEYPFKSICEQDV
jgi:hypothetical protein